MTEQSTIGQRTPLIEGEAKVTGKIRYISDLLLPGMLHARLVTSPHAHARLLGIDTSEALALPGVVAVLTAGDLPPVEPVNRQRLLLARNWVIFAGQPVALILAEDEAAAQDALDLVRVDYEPLPAAITLDEALAEDAPLVWPGGTPGKAEEAAAHGLDVDDAVEKPKKASNVAKQSHFERGDVAAGFAEADVIIERHFTVPMVHQNPMETHGCAVQLDPLTDEVTVWSSTQALFNVRQAVAAILDRLESDVRCVATPVGGGFGGKGVLYEPLLALASRLVGRPIRLILNRYEELVATNPAPPGHIRLKLGARKDGSFTALEGQVIFNSGCYPGSPIGNALVVTGSIHRFPHVQLDGLDVLSFKPSVRAYRAPGVPQGMFALESLVDDIARALDLDPLELRLQNAAQPGDPMIPGETWPVMGMSEVLKALQAHPAWQNRASFGGLHAEPGWSAPPSTGLGRYQRGQHDFYHVSRRNFWDSPR